MIVYAFIQNASVCCCSNVNSGSTKMSKFYAVIHVVILFFLNFDDISTIFCYYSCAHIPDDLLYAMETNPGNLSNP